MDDFIGLCAVILSLAAPTVIVYIIVRARHREKMELIKTGQYDKLSIAKAPNMGNSVLAWGMVFVALGLAGVTFFLITGFPHDDDSLYMAIASLMGGAALIIYWKITAPIRQKAMELFELQIEDLREARRDAQAEKRLLDNYGKSTANASGESGYKE